MSTAILFVLFPFVRCDEHSMLIAKVGTDGSHRGSSIPLRPPPMGPSASMRKLPQRPGPSDDLTCPVQVAARDDLMAEEVSSAEPIPPWAPCDTVRYGAGQDATLGGEGEVRASVARSLDGGPGTSSSRVEWPQTAVVHPSISRTSRYSTYLERGGVERAV